MTANRRRRFDLTLGGAGVFLASCPSSSCAVLTPSASGSSSVGSRTDGNCLVPTRLPLGPGRCALRRLATDSPS